MIIHFSNEKKVDLDVLAKEIEERTGAPAELKVVREAWTHTKKDPDTGEEYFQSEGMVIEVVGVDAEHADAVVESHDPDRSVRDAEAKRIEQLRADVLAAVPELVKALGISEENSRG